MTAHGRCWLKVPDAELPPLGEPLALAARPGAELRRGRVSTSGGEVRRSDGTGHLADRSGRVSANRGRSLPAHIDGYAPRPSALGTLPPGCCCAEGTPYWTSIAPRG